MSTFRPVPIDAVLELRERVLTPGHPGRPVIWVYDSTATHYGMFDGDLLLGCVSLTQEALPTEPAVRPYHLHSMAIEPSRQAQGLGRLLLGDVIGAVIADGCDLVWATARPSAVDFYRRCGFEVGSALRIAPTSASMSCVTYRPSPTR
jgi:GNAT superfamily N-acetyltransferase